MRAHPGGEARADDLARIRSALFAAAAILRDVEPGGVGVVYKAHGSPVTDADLAVDALLRRELPRGDEGWLSEETTDDRARLERHRVWVVDPIDGTREFMAGIPEWCISIGLVEDGVAVAGGIYNPRRDELFLGSRETGMTLNDRPVRVSGRGSLAGATVLVNRWALGKRSGQALLGRGFTVQPVGPLAYSVALVAAGRADATWSRSSKWEWDIAAGAALVIAAGGHASDWSGRPLRFNRWPPQAPGMLIATPALVPQARALMREVPPGGR